MGLLSDAPSRIPHPSFHFSLDSLSVFSPSSSSLPLSRLSVFSLSSLTLSFFSPYSPPILSLSAQSEVKCLLHQLLTGVDVMHEHWILHRSVTHRHTKIGRHHRTRHKLAVRLSCSILCMLEHIVVRCYCVCCVVVLSHA